MKKIFLLMCILFVMVLTGCQEEVCDEKPVIYLYPEKEMEVKVQLDYDGKLVCTYPEYDNGWDVVAQPDGTLCDYSGKTYSYLFWEGNTHATYDFSKGFVVKGSETAEFLEEKLSEIGLNPKETNEFIVYWLPRMQENKYNLITFQTKAYTDVAKLHITPEPDSILRVFMAYKELEEPIEIEKPAIAPFERKGFTVVEWGGAEVK
ncbi:MAG: hypothetical protein IJE43_25830 [Alphaproteobacteria bacterium]|nr:hypothetical protein [Alphaproteobacteria bacterium]